jgi:hypothetical protein
MQAVGVDTGITLDERARLSVAASAYEIENIKLDQTWRDLNSGELVQLGYSERADLLVWKRR